MLMFQLSTHFTRTQIFSITKFGTYTWFPNNNLCYQVTFSRPMKILKQVSCMTENRKLSIISHKKCILQYLTQPTLSTHKVFLQFLFKRLGSFHHWLVLEIA